MANGIPGQWRRRPASTFRPYDGCGCNGRAHVRDGRFSAPQGSKEDLSAGRSYCPLRANPAGRVCAMFCIDAFLLAQAMRYAAFETPGGTDPGEWRKNTRYIPQKSDFTD